MQDSQNSQSSKPFCLSSSKRTPRPENVDRDHRTGVADIVRDAVQKPRVAIAVMGAPAHRKRVDIGIDPAAAAGAQLPVESLDGPGQHAIVGIEKIDGLCFRQIREHVVDRAIARPARPGISPEKHMNRRMGRRIEQQLIECLLSRITIDGHHHCHPAPGKLRSEHGLDRLQDEGCVAIKRHCHHDQVRVFLISGHWTPLRTALPIGSRRP